MANLQTLPADDLPALSANGHHQIAPLEVIDPTEEDIASQFPALVEQSLLADEAGAPRYWITVLDQSYRWAGTHYEPVRKSDLQRQIVRLAQSTTAYKKVRTNDGDQLVEYHPFTKPRLIDEALRWFQQITARDPEEINPDGLINCRNGVLRISWHGAKPITSIEPHNPSRHFVIDPPGLYFDPAADPADAERLLECLLPQGRRLFLQIAAASLDISTIRDRFGHRVPALMAIGEGQNGKDTLREALSRIQGRSSIATIGISDWQQYEAGSGRGRFSIAALDRARFSIASENSGAFKIDNLQWLKAAITGDPIPVERKKIQGVEINPRAVFLFFLNSPPLLDGGSAAILSRWAVVNMPHSYSTTPRPGQLKADPRFKHDPEWLAKSVLPALLNLMLESLADVAANGFDLEACAADLQQLREDTSHLHQFLRDEGYAIVGPADYVEARRVWADLQHWYQREGWLQPNRYGDLEHVETSSGDKPVMAARLLPGRLIALHPSLRKARETGQTRRTLIYGLAKVGPKSDSKSDPITEEELPY
jgi:putative DNA primase/helicase